MFISHIFDILELIRKMTASPSFTVFTLIFSLHLICKGDAVRFHILRMLSILTNMLYFPIVDSSFHSCNIFQALLLGKTLGKDESYSNIICIGP